MKWVVGNCPGIHSAVGNCTGSATFKCGTSRGAHCFTQHLRLKCPVMRDQHCEPLLHPTPQALRPGNAGSAKRAFRFTQHLKLEGLVMWDQRCQPLLHLTPPGIPWSLPPLVLALQAGSERVDLFLHAIDLRFELVHLGPQILQRIPCRGGSGRRGAPCGCNPRRSCRRA